LFKRRKLLVVGGGKAADAADGDPKWCAWAHNGMSGVTRGIRSRLGGSRDAVDFEFQQTSGVGGASFLREAGGFGIEL
jgi:hypothetical protein